MVLAFEMGAGEQLWSGLRAGTEHIADAVDRSGQARLGQLFRQPFQRARMRLGEGRLVHAALVGADGPQRVEVGKHAVAVGLYGIVRHQAMIRTFSFAVLSRTRPALHKAKILVLTTGDRKSVV